MPRFTSRTGTGRSKYQADTKAVADYCNGLEGQVDHKTRYELHRADERIWRLEKYTLEELRVFGVEQNPALWPSFTSNGPRTYWNAIRRATTANPMRVNVRLPGMPDDDTDVELYRQMLIETARHEHFAYGFWSAVDEQRIRSGNRPFLDDMAFYMAIRGGSFVRPWYDRDSRMPFRADLWDPKTVAYEPGMDGLDYTCHHYRAPVYRVYDRYQDQILKDEGKSYKDSIGFAKSALKADEEGNVEVYDAWWVEYDGRGEPHVWSTVVGAGGRVLQEPYEHRYLDRNPVLLLRAFGPSVETEADYREVVRNVHDTWETIYTSNKTIYPWINRILTLYALYLRNGAIGPYHARGTDLNEEQLQNVLKPFQVFQSRRPDAVVTPVANAQMASEVKELFQFLQGAEQRGGVPYSTFGQLSFEISGFAINQLQSAVGITASEMTKMMGWGLSLATDEVIQQYRQFGGSVTVSGRDNRRQPFIEQIQRAQLRDKYTLEVEVIPELPQDRLAQAQTATAWAQAGIDPLTIMDEVLKVADPREVMKRIVVWGELQNEVAQNVAQRQQAEGGFSPSSLPPESQGQLEQHRQFQPSAQQTSDEQLAAAGFSRNGR